MPRSTAGCAVRVLPPPEEAGGGSAHRSRRVAQLRASWLLGELDLEIDDAGLDRLLADMSPTRPRPRPRIVG
jgi:hypothetical protein